MQPEPKEIVGHLHLMIGLMGHRLTGHFSILFCQHLNSLRKGSEGRSQDGGREEVKHAGGISVSAYKFDYLNP